MPYLSRPDAELYYETRQEDGALPWVIFLNGMTQTTMNWKSLANQLEGQACVLMYDARGQGKSEVGEAELTLGLHADDLAALCDELKIERAHVVGFSHGARVALAFANAHAHRVERLVLCSATATPDAMARTIVQAWSETLSLGGLEAMSWASLPNILGRRFLAQNEQLIEGIIKASTKRNSPEGVRRLLDAMMSYPSLAELAQGVSAPTLVISADEDPLVTEAGAKELAQLAQGQHVLIEGVGHTIPIEAPERFIEELTKFFGAPNP